jgi:hypothetical protein
MSCHGRKCMNNSRDSPVRIDCLDKCEYGRQTSVGVVRSALRGMHQRAWSLDAMRPSRGVQSVEGGRFPWFGKVGGRRNGERAGRWWKRRAWASLDDGNMDVSRWVSKSGLCLVRAWVGFVLAGGESGNCHLFKRQQLCHVVLWY